MKTLLCITAVLFVSANVFASNINFDRFDTDKDGLISQEEAKVNDTLLTLFAELDLNQDGYLSKSELSPNTPE
ncbi:EF-hand domain-containing protein [Flavobacterium sp. W21_SRS_FM6]|uniref:EF-hand domain-containing protein n=1 Tax=Flavobacterium sp. W21_SRS_FM6 TaxID=3240268 RepID=UPI003F9156CF